MGQGNRRPRASRALSPAHADQGIPPFFSLLARDPPVRQGPSSLRYRRGASPPVLRALWRPIHGTGLVDGDALQPMAAQKRLGYTPQRLPWSIPNRHLVRARAEAGRASTTPTKASQCLRPRSARYHRSKSGRTKGLPRIRDLGLGARAADHRLVPARDPRRLYHRLQLKGAPGTQANCAPPRPMGSTRPRDKSSPTVMPRSSQPRLPRSKRPPTSAVDPTA